MPKHRTLTQAELDALDWPLNTMQWTCWAASAAVVVGLLWLGGLWYLPIAFLAVPLAVGVVAFVQMLAGLVLIKAGQAAARRFGLRAGIAAQILLLPVAVLLPAVWLGFSGPIEFGGRFGG